MPAYGERYDSGNFVSSSVFSSTPPPFPLHGFPGKPGGVSPWENSADDLENAAFSHHGTGIRRRCRYVSNYFYSLFFNDLQNYRNRSANPACIFRYKTYLPLIERRYRPDRFTGFPREFFDNKTTVSCQAGFRLPQVIASAVRLGGLSFAADQQGMQFANRATQCGESCSSWQDKASVEGKDVRQGTDHKTLASVKVPAEAAKAAECKRTAKHDEHHALKRGSKPLGTAGDMDDAKALGGGKITGKR